ncbi:MAG: Crp/Fnr family transcriptional regulator [Rhizobiaceae bacterium]|nr:Crp/Fnr family transcriptional regulator [Rhizobiaceae bacterium]
MAKVSKEQVRHCKVFAEAGDNTIVALVENSRMMNFVKNRQIIGQADMSTDVYLVVEGVARAKSFSEKGKEVSYRDIKPGEIFGEFSAIDEAPRSSAVLAVSDCVVAKISARSFRKAVTTDSNVALALVELLVEKNRALTERIHEFGTLAVRFRIQSELLRLAEATCEDGDESISFDIPTHLELANRICTHREAVTKELNYLASIDLIQITKSTVFVKNYQRFKQVAGMIDM